MTTYTEARYNRLQHQMEQAGFTLYLFDVAEPHPRAVYRLDPARETPEVVVYPFEETFRIVTDDWQLSMHLDVPASVSTAALQAAATQLF